MKITMLIGEVYARSSRSVAAWQNRSRRLLSRRSNKQKTTTRRIWVNQWDFRLNGRTGSDNGTNQFVRDITHVNDRRSQFDLDLIISLSHLPLALPAAKTNTRHWKWCRFSVQVRWAVIHHYHTRWRTFPRVDTTGGIMPVSDNSCAYRYQ